jgi:hypothetical protein
MLLFHIYSKEFLYISGSLTLKTCYFQTALLGMQKQEHLMYLMKNAIR